MAKKKAAKKGTTKVVTKTAAAPKNLPERPAQAIDLFRNSLCLSVDFSRPGIMRKLDTHDVDVKLRGQPKEEQDIEKERLKIQQQLLDSEEYDKIASFEGQVRGWVKTKALRGAEMFKRGTYLVPYGLLHDVLAYLKEAKNYYDELVDEFCAKYPQRVNESKKALKGAFDQTMFPSVQKMRQKFRMSWRTFTLTTPQNLKSLDETLFQEAAQQMNEDMKDLYVEIQQGLRQGFKEAVGHLVNALQPKEDGKKKKFYESNVEKLLEFLDTFSAKNIVNDADCAILVQQARALVKGKKVDVFAEQVRTDDSFRETMLKQFSQLGKQLEGMVYTDESPDVDI